MTLSLQRILIIHPSLSYFPCAHKFEDRQRLNECNARLRARLRRRDTAVNSTPSLCRPSPPALERRQCTSSNNSILLEVQAQALASAMEDQRMVSYAQPMVHTAHQLGGRVSQQPLPRCA